MGKSPGQVAYESYVTQHKGISPVDGKVLPSWEGLTEEQQEQWNAAVLKHAVTRHEVREILTGEEPTDPREEV